MGARSGNNYLSALRKLKAALWLDDTRVADPTIHPAFIRRARAIASLYDLQMEHPAAMTYRLDDGDRAGLSFLQPRSIDDLRKRSIMFRRWAEYSGGLLTDTPDRTNTCPARMAAAADFFATGEARYGENIHRYYREARHRDWCIASASTNSGADAPHVVDQNDAGPFVSGTLTLAGLGPFAEELVIFPTAPPSSPAHALVFAISTNTPGLALRCRATTATPRAPFPELQCVVIFDRVLIPWARVFLCGDVTRCAAMLEETGARLNLTHQAVIRETVALEFRLGSMLNLAHRSNALVVPQVRTRLDEMTVATQLAQSLLQAAEAGAHADRWGQWVPLAEPLAVGRRHFAQLDPRNQT
jgi:4-hydroxyphenylacetate 3-monooxygenase